MLMHKNIGKETGYLYGCIACRGGCPKGLTSKIPHKGALLTLKGECYEYA
jgi:hypothetical protein